MTIRELIEELKTYPQDSVVVMSEDGEGNGYSPLSGFSDGVYVPESTWNGDYHVGRALTKELEEAGYTEEDVYDGEDAQDCVVLWPTN
jgi:hypothetical protein